MKKIVIFLISLSMISALCGCGLNFQVSVDYSYDDAGFTAAEQGKTVTFDGDVKKFDCDWVSGYVKIVKGDVFSICEELESSEGDYMPMYYKCENGAVSVKWVKNGTDSKEFEKLSKKLTVTVPEGLEKLDLNNVSSQISITLGSTGDVDINNVSGNCSLYADEFKNVKYNGVSGIYEVAGSASGNIGVNVVSDVVKLGLKPVGENQRYDINTVSGSVEIMLPETVKGYKVDSAGIKFDFSSDFGGTEYGDGSIIIDFKTVSAGLKILNGSK